MMRAEPMTDARLREITKGERRVDFDTVLSWMARQKDKPYRDSAKWKSERRTLEREKAMSSVKEMATAMFGELLPCLGYCGGRIK